MFGSVENGNPNIHTFWRFTSNHYNLWLHNLWKLIINLPTNISKLVKENRQKTGYNALAYGLAASSAGDIESTQKYAARHNDFDNKDLTEMLFMHAAHLSG